MLDRGGEIRNDFAVDLETSAQTLVAPGLDHSTFIVISQNGQKVAFSVTEGDRISLHVGDAGGGLAASPPSLPGLRPCGALLRRWPLPYIPARSPSEARPEAEIYAASHGSRDRQRQSVARAADPESIVAAGVFGADSQWIARSPRTRPPQERAAGRSCPGVPEPVPASEWIEARAVPAAANFATRGNYFQFYSGDKLVAVRFGSEDAVRERSVRSEAPARTRSSPEPTRDCCVAVGWFSLVPSSPARYG